MRIIDPQTATLTNIEVLAYLTANPPRRPPNPPPNIRNWVPSPDLRDHNTVVKEIHNYVTRLAPHLLKYPQYIPADSSTTTSSSLRTQQQQQQPLVPPPLPRKDATPLDIALRDLITRLQPYGLTKGEVLMIVNLGVGLHAPPPEAEREDGEAMDGVEQEQGQENRAAAEEGQGGMTIPEEEYGAIALFDTIVEEREERLTDEDVLQILRIIRETIGSEIMKGGVGGGGAEKEGEREEEAGVDEGDDMGTHQFVHYKGSGSGRG